MTGLTWKLWKLICLHVILWNMEILPLLVGHEKLSNHQIFPRFSHLQIAAMFKIGNSKELPPIPDHLSEQCKDFIRKCLQRDPSQRPTAMELLQHRFIQYGVRLEKSVISDPLEHLAVISCRPNSRVTILLFNWCIVDDSVSSFIILVVFSLC